MDNRIHYTFLQLLFSILIHLAIHINLFVKGSWLACGRYYWLFLHHSKSQHGFSGRGATPQRNGTLPLSLVPSSISMIDLVCTYKKSTKWLCSQLQSAGWLEHLVETSASFTEQLSCPKRIFVLFKKSMLSKSCIFMLISHSTVNLAQTNTYILLVTNTVIW